MRRLAVMIGLGAMLVGSVPAGRRIRASGGSNAASSGVATTAVISGAATATAMVTRSN